MTAVVVYESVYGNTRAIAEAIAEGLGAGVVPVHDAAAQAPDADLLVVGCPTHMHGLPTERSREMAASAAHEDGGVSIDADAVSEPGLRRWLHDMPDRQGARAAAFDTRLDKSTLLTGVASRGIAKRLRRHGYDVVGSESFLVEDSEGPLEQGELDRARAWGAQLAGSAGGAGEAGPAAGAGATGGASEGGGTGAAGKIGERGGTGSSGGPGAASSAAGAGSASSQGSAESREAGR